jgi:HEAT repeat protein
MDEWPDYIIKAFEAVDLADTEEDAEKAIESFASRWGGLDLETFQRVLETGQGRDKALAIFALGYSGKPEVRSLLLPLLHSLHRLERWASALCLGQMQDESAFPVLQEMLTEGLFDQEIDGDTSMDEDTTWYESQRTLVTYLLGEWNNPKIVPALRQALQATWQREQQATSSRHPWTDFRQFWHYYQDSLALTLGQLGAFGALTTLDLPLPRLRIAMIYLVLGHLLTVPGKRYRNTIDEIILVTHRQREQH